MDGIERLIEEIPSLPGSDDGDGRMGDSAREIGRWKNWPPKPQTDCLGLCKAGAMTQ